MRGAAFAILFAVLALIGGGLLAAAELSTVYEVVVGSLDIVRRTKSGSDQHSDALLILAAATVPLALGALRGARKPTGGRVGARAPAAALLVLGAVALAVALLGDLPDAREKGPLPESQNYENARARPAQGLYLEIAGGGLLVLAGAGLLVGRRRPAGGHPEPARPRAADQQVR